MQHNIREAGTLTYVLEINASAEDLALDVQQAVRKKRSASNLKGFRPGRVPHHWIRRVYKRELEEEVTKTVIDEAYEDLVTQSGKYKVTGEPRRLEFSYELDGDLHVELEFATEPEFELRDVEEQVVEVKCVEVNDKLVEKMGDFIRQKNAYMRRLTDEESIGEEGLGESDSVMCETTELDPSTGVVLVGVPNAEVEIQLGEQEYAADLEYQALSAALVGHRKGDKVQVRFTESPKGGVLESKPVERAYEATIMSVERRQVPEIDDDFVRKASSGLVNSAEEWPGALQRLAELNAVVWNDSAIDDAIVDRMLEIQNVPIPESLIRRSLAEYRQLSSARVSNEAEREAYFRKHLAWHYLEEKMHQENLFQWPVEPETDEVEADPDYEAIRMLEDAIGADSRTSGTPSRRRCALDYLEGEFDIVRQPEEDSAEYHAAFASLAWSYWSKKADSLKVAQGKSIE